jgi:hypothetical protein
VVRRHHSLAIIGLTLAALSLWGCIAYRDGRLHRYEADRITPLSPSVDVQYEARVMMQVPSTLTQFGLKQGELRGMLVKESNRLLPQAGITIVEDSRSDLRVTLTLDKYTDTENTLLNSYYGYFSGITFAAIPFYTRGAMALDADVEKAGRPLAQYHYKQMAHLWAQIFLVFALPFYSEDRLERKMIDDLLFNFIADFQRDSTGFAGRS